MLNSINTGVQTPPQAVSSPVKTPTSMALMSLPKGAGDVPEPPLEEMDIMLELLMEDLNLTEDKKSVLRNLPSDRKWVMLQQHLGERYRDGAARDIHKDSEEINKLQSNPDKELLTNLVVSLRSRPIRWISNFIENGGLSILIANLKVLEDANKYLAHANQ